MASDLRSSDGKFLYLFNRVIGPDTYILFKIDILKHLENYKPSPTPSDNDNNRYESLHPLLVFPEPVLPYHCVCAKMGSIFYFLCGTLWKNTFGFKDSKRTDVYKIKESDLSGIRPSELNLDGKDYLIKTASMNGNKHLPTVFVVQNKLYVLSHHISDTQFEVYSPDSDSWRVLPPPPPDCHGWPWLSDSYVVMERNQTVYFMKNRCPFFLSFNFEKEMWGTVMMPNNMNSLPVLPSFASPVVIMGDKGFGFLLDEEDPRLLSLTICAIPLPDNGGEISYESLLPSIAPDDEFKHALDSSRCPAVTDKFLENFSESIVALDGGKIMCVVSYACGSVMGSYAECLDIYTSYATLTFFEHIGCEDIDRDKKVAGELVFNKYFKTKYLHNVQLIVKTTTLPTCSAIRACLFEDL